MSMITLKSYFIDQVKDLYSAEKQLLDFLPKLEDAATEQDLKDAIHEHCTTTKEQAERLKDALKTMGESPRAKHCEAMSGIIKEGEAVFGERANDLVRDVALVATGRRIAHYDIAGYSTVIALAKKVAPMQVLLDLEKTHLEATNFDNTLSKIAEGGWFTRGLNDEAGEYDKEYREASAEGGSKPPLEDWTKSELQERAAKLNVDGRSTMSKPELVGAIRDNQ